MREGVEKFAIKYEEGNKKIRHSSTNLYLIDTPPLEVVKLNIAGLRYCVPDMSVKEEI